MEFKSEYYNETQIDSFIISYGFKEGIISEKNIIKSDLSFQKYKNNNLVISFNPLDFGKVLTINKLVNETLYILQTKDNLITKILFSKENNSKFIRVLPKSNKLANNFITLDIETYIKNNVLIPYCISIYDGKIAYSYFISDFKDSQDLILTALKSILTRKYNGYNVYMHNMAKFDIIFLLKHLVKLGDVTPIIHNGRIISINLNFGKNLEYRLQFKDSYLILLASLDKLTKGFIVETLKSIFPFLFVNEDNLDYIGEVPEFKYFYNNIKLSEYNNYISKFYNN